MCKLGSGESILSAPRTAHKDYMETISAKVLIIQILCKSRLQRETTLIFYVEILAIYEGC